MEEPYWEVNDDEYDVIDMEAEEKLCNELITKEQAFQVIADNNSSTKMTLACYDALLDGIAKAKAIEAEPIRHWIPVSERLPEEHNFVLVTINNAVEFACRVGERWEDDEGTTISDSWYKTKVTAWMPLPEPYKGE